MARWTEVPNLTYGDDFIVTLSAEHVSGINRVEFSIDGGAPVIVRTKTPHPDTGYPEYLLPVGDLNDGLHEVTATVFANSGSSLVLGGDDNRLGNLNALNNGLGSFFFRKGGLVTVTVPGDYPTLDALFEEVDPAGMRVLISGDFVGLSSDPGRGVYPYSDNPILFEGDGTARMTGSFGSISRRSLVFKDIEFAMPFDPGLRLFYGDRNTVNMIAWVGCTFTPDSDDPNAWQLFGWSRFTKTNWKGGIYSVDNLYSKLNKGPDRVTMSKGDTFEYLTWDCFSANPGCIVNLFVNKGTGTCDNHSRHCDVIQYLKDSLPVEFGPTRNRLFVDWNVMNYYGQVGHIEGSPADSYEDFYFARWVVDGHFDQSMNNYASVTKNWTLKDLTMRGIDFELFGSGTYQGLIAENIITEKWKANASPDVFWANTDGGYFVNWHVEDPGNNGWQLTSTGPVDWKNPTPEVVEVPECTSYPNLDPVVFRDAEEIDLSNTVFGPPCYTQEDLAQLLAVFGSDDPEWDLNDDGVVNGYDLTLLLANTC